MSILLGVNIDHIATLRQARLTNYPNPLYAGLLVQEAGADSITVHLREDRRHIQDKDVLALKQNLDIRLNFEMAATSEMIDFATNLRPANACIVPEKRAELTTEGGLNLLSANQYLRDGIKKMQDADIEVSVFIDADIEQIQAALDLGVSSIELHTGVYADSNLKDAQAELKILRKAADFALEHNMILNAGHGLHYQNTQALIETIPELNELNIGHSIISKAVFIGLKPAVQEMLAIVKK